MTSNAKSSSTPEHRVLAPGPRAGVFRAPDGSLVTPPSTWACLAPGDAALTRRVKAAGPSFSVVEKKGNKTFSRGVWAERATIDALRAALVIEREDPRYAQKLASGAARRARVQADYEVAFEDSVRAFLAFHARYAEVAAALAARVAAHATPVGSGTVARTQRIPVAERAEAAVIAWLRHQTTAYDGMHIPRVKGARREVRRMLAARSVALLEQYRRGADVDVARCPLQAALRKPTPLTSTTPAKAPSPATAQPSLVGTPHRPANRFL